MLRRVSPAVIISVSAAASVYLCESRPLLMLLFTICAFLIGAAGAVFRNLHRRISHVSVCIAVGIAAGVAGCLHFRLDTFFTGVILNDVDAITVTLYDDSRISDGEGSVHYANLRQSEATDRGIVTSARGRVLILDGSGKGYATGESLQARGQLTTSDSKEFHFYFRAEKVETKGFASPVWEVRHGLKTNLVNRIQRLGFPASSLLVGLLFGERGSMPAELRSGFRKTGTVHLLAVSGLHVGILYFIVVMLLKPFRSNTVKWVIGTFFLIGYLFVVGPKPSLMRATAALILAGLAGLWDRDPDALNILGLVFLILLVLTPYSLFSLSFQLSFTACLGMLTVGRGLNRCMESTVPPFIRLPLCYSIGAQAATLPIVLSEFGVYYPVSTIATLILVPLVMVYIWGGLLFLLFQLWPVFVPFFSWTMQKLFAIIRGVNLFFSRVPGIYVTWDHRFWLLLAPVLVFYFYRRNRSLPKVDESR